MSTTELINRQVAAEWLAEQLQDKNAEQWALWLRNNANTARKATYRVSVESVGRGSFYQVAELANFVDFEKQCRMGRLKLTGRAAEIVRAFGIGKNGGSTTGKKLKVTGINPQIDESTGSPFVQLIIDDPLTVYRLELDQAKEILLELSEAIDVCENAQKVCRQ